MRMNRLEKRRAAEITADQYAVDHPFVRWYAAYHSRDAATSDGRDLRMGPLASKWFSVGIDDDRVPVLGIAEHDVEPIMSMRWTASFFLRKILGADWIVLSADDARTESPRGDDPVPLRLWLPVLPGLLDGWLEVPPPSSLRIIETAIRRGKPQPKGGSPLALLSLGLKGKWEAREKIAA
jgi:hypothetical protein